MQLELIDEKGATWNTTKAALDDVINRSLGVVNATSEINGHKVIGQFSWKEWEQGKVVPGADISHRVELAKVNPEWVDVQEKLSKIFTEANLRVEVELTRDGLVIRSEDNRVSVQDTGYVLFSN